jgi:uncharacterized SAM-binding protein YcdF (DUF218 family)
MFFVVSKILSFLAQPLPIILILLVSGWIVRNARWKKILTRTAFGLLLFTSNPFIANLAMRAWEMPVIPFRSIAKKYDFGVLLTGVTKTEATPKDRVYFGRGADRATNTLHLYKLGIIRKVIVSGGSGRLDGSGVKEADDLADFLKLAGVPAADIIIENGSRNTHQSAVEVSALMAGLEGPREALLITSGYHMPRAMACFRKSGLTLDPFPVDPQSDRSRYTPAALFIPSPDAMLLWQTLLKEWIGFLAYRVAGYI